MISGLKFKSLAYSNIAFEKVINLSCSYQLSIPEGYTQLKQEKNLGLSIKNTFIFVFGSLHIFSVKIYSAA